MQSPAGGEITASILHTHCFYVLIADNINKNDFFPPSMISERLSQPERFSLWEDDMWKTEVQKKSRWTFQNINTSLQSQMGFLQKMWKNCFCEHWQLEITQFFLSGQQEITVQEPQITRTASVCSSTSRTLLSNLCVWGLHYHVEERFDVTHGVWDFSQPARQSAY